MKVMWVTNTIFPDLSKEMGNDAAVVGGWMFGLANALVKNGVELIVVTARPKITEYTTAVNGITYFLLKSEKKITEYDYRLEKRWKNLIEETNPEIVHIHGTEYAFGLSLMKACPELNYVISIQGLISLCARYYNGGIPIRQIKKYSTIRDLLKKDGILQSQKKFYSRGETIEKRYFKLGKHFIGRTQWDFDHTTTLNGEAIYHFCNESLRNGFYTSKKWRISDKTNHSIFLSQAIYPLKGLHQVINAVAFIKNDFPDLKIRVSGGNITKVNTFRDKMALSGYGNYIIDLIRKFELEEQVEFTGLLNEDQIIEEYLKCNVFICPSSIENSPNSLGEAQLLGVPCLAAYVGGVTDMVEHGKSGLLYRFEETEMLAQAIKKIFLSASLAEKLSLGGIQTATKRHDRDTNLKKTLEIYQTVMNE